MHLSIRVLLGFFAVVGLAAYFLLNTFLQEVKPGVKQGMEVALVNTANVLAELAAADLQRDTLQDGAFAQAVHAYQQRRYVARIHDLEQLAPSFRVYVTDIQGRLRFDSAGEKIGSDYSAWNDVKRTLRGEYGARSSRANPDDESSSVMFVAAPIKDPQGVTIGVLSVGAPSAAVVPYARRSQQRVLFAGLVLMGASLAIGVALSWTLTRSINRMRSYAREVAQGHRAQLPKVGGGELAELGRALETMRDKLEDRRYVERYVATLTHEMKSPLAAIRGAAELLDEDMPDDDRHRFVANIRQQEARVRALLERMLSQAEVEQRQALQDPQEVDVPALCKRIVASKELLLAQKNLRINTALPPATARGEVFLLEQALSNLIDNAITYSPLGGTIALNLRLVGQELEIEVLDQGPGVPDFAQARVFEPFYSLPHPQSGRKGTGLGLSFVKEVVALHGGQAGLDSSEGGGTRAWLRLPRS